jgi:hypothetical protein
MASAATTRVKNKPTTALPNPTLTVFPTAPIAMSVIIDHSSDLVFVTWYIAATMRKHKVGDHVLVKLSGGRIVEAVVKAITESTDRARLQVSFGNETALIYLWQIVKEAR